MYEWIVVYINMHNYTVYVEYINNIASIMIIRRPFNATPSLVYFEIWFWRNAQVLETEQ